MTERSVSFEPPPGLADMVDMLWSRNFVVLSGGPAAGLRSAGRYLLDQLGPRLGRPPTFRMATVVDDVRLNELLVDGERDRGLLLDLCSVEPAALDQVAGQLADFATTLVAQRCFAVVIVPATAGPSFADGHLSLARPDGRAVFRRRLTAAGFPPHVTDRWVDHTAVADRLADAWPADIARMTDLIRELDNQHDGPEAVGDLFDDAVDDWSGDIRAGFEKWDEEWRAHVTALSFLEGSTPAVVLQHGQRLLDELGYPPATPYRPFSLPGATQRFAEWDGVIGTDGAMFAKPAYARAVRHYVWREYPEHQDDFQRWFTGLPADTRIVTRIVDLLATHGQGRRLTATALDWLARADSDADDDRRAAVTRLLATAATDRRVGGQVRRQLAAWASEPTTTERLAAAVADACGELADAFPNIAMALLRQLARRREEPVATAVLAAVLRAGASEGGYDYVLDHVVGWSADRDPERRHTGLRCFVTLTDPLRNPPRPAACPPLVAGWIAVLRHSNIDVIEPAVVSWLHGAARWPAHRAALLDVLVSAAAESVDTFVTMNLIRHYWSTGRGGASAVDDRLRRTVAAELATKLDEVDPVLAAMAR